MAATADPRRTDPTFTAEGPAPAGRARDPRQAVFVISVAAELAGVHPQTLRIYERKGLLDPARTGGGARRYSEADISQLRRILDLTNEGLNLAGVKRVLALEAELDRLRERLSAALDETRDAVDRTHRRYRRDLVPLSQAVELFGRDPR
jgi:MerR family transcriptional regulator/heat shock protein HspR